MLKTGLSTCGRIPEEPLFREYAEAGIEVMEVSPNQGGYDMLDFAKLKKLGDTYGVELRIILSNRSIFRRRTTRFAVRACGGYAGR